MIHRYLITYDIPDNRRRQKLHDLLSGYGQRVNDSVFEVTLTKTRHKELLAKITKLIKRQEDSVRIYPVCNNCLPKIKTLGDFDPLPFILADTFI